MNTSHVRAMLVRAKELYPSSRHLQHQWAKAKLRGHPPLRVRIGICVHTGRIPRTLEEVEKARRVIL